MKRVTGRTCRRERGMRMSGRMHRWRLRKVFGAVALAAVFFMLQGYAGRTVQAADVRRISRISLKFETDIQPGMNFGDETIEISASSERYYVDDYQIMNSGFIWENRMTPRIQVTVMPADGWYFGSIGRDEITLKGGWAVYAKSRWGAGDALLIELTLEPLNRYMEPLSGLRLESDGAAYWDPVSNAGSYELRVYRDGRVFGNAVTVRSERYSCWEKLITPGNYAVEVRPVNQADPEIKGDWVRSGELKVDPAMAAGFQGRPVTEVDGQVIQAVWRQEADGRWWYDRGDGTYPADCWEEIQGKWYCFDPEGYMKTGWFLWEDRWYYCTEKGYMLSNCITEDGYWLGADGAMILQ